MRRREFVSLVGTAAAWSLAARAQQPPLPVVALVNLRSAEASVRLANAFRKGLNEAGWVDGQNVTVEYNWLDGRFDRVSSVIADIVRRRVAVIATPGTIYGAQAAKAATTTIPIVFGVGDDPVKQGLVASLARPGGNVTGYNFLLAEIGAKRLELLHGLVPKAARFAMLVNPENVPIAARITRGARSGACYWTANADSQRWHQGRDRGGLRHPRAR
jgi:putative tryptophan/tyrosine transport system substrate-binding protein